MTGFTWQDVTGHGDDGQDLLPEALCCPPRRLVEAGIYDAGAWYDVDYAGYMGELLFYRRVCDNVCGPDGLIVEIGAGTGRLTVPLAKGRTIWAVEPAAGMRERLHRKLGLHGLNVGVETALADTFVGPPDGPPPSLVIFAFNGVLHLDNRALLDRSLRHIRSKLPIGGCLAMDLTGPYWETMRRGHTPWGRVDERVHPSTGKPFLTCDRSAYHGPSRTMRIDIRYAPADSDELIQTALFQHMWTTTEILAATVDAGFVIEDSFGDVDLSPFHEGSPRLLFVARATGP